MEGVYGHRAVADLVRASRAIVTNQIARVAPASYVRMTGETGRGREVVSPGETAAYFLSSVYEYMDALNVPREQLERFWRGKRIVEYGPGDIPGVALLLAAVGAESVLCVDRFPLVRFSAYQQEVIRALEAVLPNESCRTSLRACLADPSDPGRGLADSPVSYCVTPSGLVGRPGIADLVISRAVLEHVNDLPATFSDMTHLLASDGVTVHKVDLKSHGLHRVNRLDFLTWPDRLWHLMFSHKGAPNRLRVDSYLREIRRTGLRINSLEPCEVASLNEVHEVRPFLAEPFRNLSDEELSCLSFWLVCRPGSRQESLE